MAQNALFLSTPVSGRRIFALCKRRLFSTSSSPTPSTNVVPSRRYSLKRVEPVEKPQDKNLLFWRPSRPFIAIRLWNSSTTTRRRILLKATESYHYASVSYYVVIAQRINNLRQRKPTFPAFATVQQLLSVHPGEQRLVPPVPPS